MSLLYAHYIFWKIFNRKYSAIRTLDRWIKNVSIRKTLSKEFFAPNLSYIVVNWPCSIMLLLHWKWTVLVPAKFPSIAYTIMAKSAIKFYLPSKLIGRHKLSHLFPLPCHAIYWLNSKTHEQTISVALFPHSMFYCISIGELVTSILIFATLKYI